METVMGLGTEQIEAYKRDGYLCVGSVFTHREADALRRLVYRLYCKFCSEDDQLAQLDEPWNDPAFDEKMIALRASDPKTFGALYDCAQYSVDVLRFVTDPRLLSIAADCLGDDAENLSYSGIMYRMDPPKDQRNALSWHQDRAYYPQNEDGNHGLVLTVALQDITAATGALVICPQSHREGLLAPVTADKSDYETTEQRQVPEDAIDRYSQVHAEMKKGDLALMNLNLFHRSGVNDGDRIRFTALCRFHRIMADDYVPYGLLYQFNNFLSERIWKARKEY